jgi:tetratricopeptide (TPR) repeat protein
LIIQLSSKAHLKPLPIVVEALLKGARKQGAVEELIGPVGWDRYDKRFQENREALLEKKASDQRAYKDSLLEKFEFLQSQRMNEQAGRVLRRMVELYPEDRHFAKLKAEFEERWAREVLANHAASLNHEKIDRTVTAPSTRDEEMLECFVKEGEAISLQHREFTSDLAIAFWFMEDYGRALDILAWAPPSLANDWLKAEVLFAARRFIEAMEHLNQLEIKYINDPETTFAVSYLRAQCLNASGQQTLALEILQGIVRVRPNYRSVNALLQEWSEGAAWE